MVKAWAVIWILFITVTSIAATGEPFTAKVIRVIDGNTLEIESPENGKQRFVFFGVDSPELGQQFGEEAKRFLERKVLNKTVEVTPRGKDRSGNFLGILMLGSKDLRVEMLREGLAWTSERNAPEDLQAYMSWARQKGKGLWQVSNPVPPWVYRREQSMSQPKSS